MRPRSNERGRFLWRPSGPQRSEYTGAVQLDPAKMAPADRYKLLIGAIVPRPIGFVSSESPDRRRNLAPFSFFNGIGANPMSLLFCPANKPDGSEKDTLRNVLPENEGGTGEFVVNIVSESFERQMAACAEPLAYGQSEFELSGLTPAPSVRVKPARVAESLVSFECRTLRVVRLAPGVAAGGNVVIGEVVMIHAADDAVSERLRVNPDVLKAIGRMGGLGYCRTSDPANRFEMPMGREALDGRAPAVQQPPK
jgi:flavin reductase (DIM6/NTAB) family NADH-FMN oxidoreductase RutF